MREGPKIWRIPEDGFGCHAAVRSFLVTGCPGQRERWRVDNRSERDNMIIPVGVRIDFDSIG